MLAMSVVVAFMDPVTFSLFLSGVGTECQAAAKDHGHYKLMYALRLPSWGYCADVGIHKWFGHGGCQKLDQLFSKKNLTKCSPSESKIKN
jgi:hypothetical protein